MMMMMMIMRCMLKMRALVSTLGSHSMDITERARGRVGTQYNGEVATMLS